ncbi:MAG: hypothetical protein PVF17_04705 [Ignavibacteria bacterium]
MTKILNIIIFFLLFLFIIRLIRVIKRLWFSSKNTTNFIRNDRPKKRQDFKDVEEAEYREIPSDKKNENGENQN